ncbi:uncharacterized protein CELE_T03G6.7 [Caenorhabditis elegans]|uniref:Uncharacterized protein n=1 Tax=Caenorhabditis elegans TaxID=6239 RepID=A0A2K5AU31_CAEEL|nr:Uncharacterized protein CELE_T03G6.7 [Caenorhabditis elegans]SPC48676.2 Uncharacterized protein CELE_T03G6.7 [Caenorhabditis elegans]|eukprot:NP_001348815.2 Uncharacterized protein CELE_T03G6.7 [Caenorhabditis elegans]
MMYRIMWQL